MTPDFTTFHSRREIPMPRVPIISMLCAVGVCLLWIALVLGILSFVMGLIGLWLVKFQDAWVFFWLGGNAACWSAMLLGWRLGFESDSVQEQVTSHRVECAWCRTIIREGIEPASHGICLVCLAKQLRDEETRI